MTSSIQKVHFYIYDRNDEFRETFATLMKNQMQDEGCISIGDANSDYPIQATVVTDKAYLSSSLIAPAITGLSIGAIVSPGTSFGWMEGGFDLTINQYYSSLFGIGIRPRIVTNAVQQALLHRKSGSMIYTPFQSAERIPAETLLTNIRASIGATRTESGLPSYFDDRADVPDLIHVPIMPTPQRIHHLHVARRLCDHVIFNCMWNVMSKLSETHLDVPETENSTLNVMLTGMGTGIGGVSPKDSALYMFKAIYLYSRLRRMRQEATPSQDIAMYSMQKLKEVPTLPGSESVHNADASTHGEDEAETTGEESGEEYVEDDNGRGEEIVWVEHDEDVDAEMTQAD